MYLAPLDIFSGVTNHYMNYLHRKMVHYDLLLWDILVPAYFQNAGTTEISFPLHLGLVRHKKYFQTKAIFFSLYIYI